MYFGFKNLSVGYGKKMVIQNLNLEFPKGKVVTIIGQNGCGKSSLLKTISKAVTPRSGQIIYQDKKLSQYPPKMLAQKIAYLAAGPYFTAGHRCADTGILWPISAFKIRQRVDGSGRGGHRQSPIFNGSRIAAKPDTVHALRGRTAASLDRHDHLSGTRDPDFR